MLLPVLAASSPTYRIVDLGAPPQSQAMDAIAINNRGEVLVRATDYQTGKDANGEPTFRTGHGYLWRAGQFFDFGEPKPNKLSDPTSVVPTAFNDFSIVVGTQGSGIPVFMSGLTDVDSFIWRGKAMDDLGVGWSSIPLGINNLGDVVGDFDYRGFARIQGKFHWIGTLSHVPARNDSVAVAINDRRLILGNSTYGGTPGKIDYSLPTRPFTIDGRQSSFRMRPVPLPAGVKAAEGLALNDEGTILMRVRETEKSGASLFLFDGRRFTRLPNTSSASSFRDARLSNRNEVVATAVDNSSPEVTHPVLWREGRSVALPKFEGWTLQTAVGINDKGQICGTGTHDGRTRAYVLTPN